jgi:histone deacetylase 1/2
MFTRPRTAYYYKEDIGHHYYGSGHPMKPFRIKLAHHLILNYGLFRKMECYKQHAASAEEMASFHSDDYIDFLRRVTPEGIKAFQGQMQKCSWAHLSPPWDFVFSLFLPTPPGTTSRLLFF